MVSRTVGLVQRFLCVQVNIPVGAACSFELGVTDSMGNRRRVFVSSAFRVMEVNPLHAKLPLDHGHLVVRGCWCNLCFDLEGIVSHCFPSCEFRSLDHIIIGADCKVRNVFTLRRAPHGAVSEMYPGTAMREAVCVTTCPCATPSRLLSLLVPRGHRPHRPRGDPPSVRVHRWCAVSNRHI